jgi:hypothetical protein
MKNYCKIILNCYNLCKLILGDLFMGTVSAVNFSSSLSLLPQEGAASENATVAASFSSNSPSLAVGLDSISPMSTNSMGSISAAPSLPALAQDTIASMISTPAQASHSQAGQSLAAQLSLTETRESDTDFKEKELPAGASASASSSVNPEEIVTSEKRDQIVQLGQKKVLEILQQNAASITSKFLPMMMNPDKLAEGQATILKLALTLNLTDEQNAVSSWITKFVTEQLKVQYQSLIPAFSGIPGFSVEKYNTGMSVLANQFVHPKAADITVQMKEISAQWVKNLLKDSKEGKVT